VFSGMSAPPPEANIRRSGGYIGFVPNPDMVN
jgi:hypothetical protein